MRILLTKAEMAEGVAGDSIPAFHPTPAAPLRASISGQTPYPPARRPDVQDTLQQAMEVSPAGGPMQQRYLGGGAKGCPEELEV
jgi:hypothetical protein